MNIERIRTDILILGTGGAGLFAALHAKQTDPSLQVTLAVKGLMGKCGCTRMVQGGYNVALADDDSIERHFMDTIVGGKWLPRQDLAWRLCVGAVERVRELENEIGCFFDRNPDGSLHQKAFAGQSFDRTVHKGDLTGIEIINRLMEQVRALDVHRLEEHRAIELIPAADGSGISGALMIDMRGGGYRLVQAKAVLLATGGGPTMYRYHTPSGDKTCDGLAMALRYGLKLRDMEMVQFHPTGLLGGPYTRMTGTVLEEGLRGAGGYLLDGSGRRFMQDYDPGGERATRDVVSRAIYAEMRAGRTTPMGGVYIEMAHLGPENVARRFPGMVKRCADCGFDLAAGRVEVVPTAHYLMGGLEFEPDCSTAEPGLFAAGEDCGGVHGANRLGGNGVANSTVFGGIAGETMARWVARDGCWRDPDPTAIDAGIARAEVPFGRRAGDLLGLREQLWESMWNHVGVLRTREGLRRGREEVGELAAGLREMGLSDGDRAFNLTWHDWLNLDNLLQISAVIAEAALAREDSRGAHFREDFPETGVLEHSTYTRVAAAGEADELAIEMVPVQFTIVRPGESLIDGEVGIAGQQAHDTHRGEQSDGRS
ncbi:MAG: FAD-binding protein [Burkholderiaceae bacterium]